MQVLAVVSPESPDGPELLLEPDEHPAVVPFKQALVNDGIPFTSFAVEDAESEYRNLKDRGANFVQEPVQMGPVTTACWTTPAGT